MWDSHPLSLGATPQQVWIDGIAQIASPHVVKKPAKLQHAPHTPNFDREAKETLDYDGLPPLAPKDSAGGIVVFANVTGMLSRLPDDVDTIYEVFNEASPTSIVVARDGRVECAGSCGNLDEWVHTSGARVVDLEGGWILPALVSFG